MLVDKHIDIKFAVMKDVDGVKYNAKIPVKLRGEDAAIDVFPFVPTKDDTIIIRPGETVTIPTGIASAIMSDRWALVLKERSSTGKYGLTLQSGVIDSGYRGEWKIIMTNNGRDVIVIAHPDWYESEKTSPMVKALGAHIFSSENAICQAMLVYVPKVEIEEIDYNTLLEIPSDRGTSGFGSTNKK